MPPNKIMVIFYRTCYLEQLHRKYIKIYIILKILKQINMRDEYVLSDGIITELIYPFDQTTK
jgi:hypothetical protein